MSCNAGLAAIKLTRTDTTHDLSQKAKKSWGKRRRRRREDPGGERSFYTPTAAYRLPAGRAGPSHNAGQIPADTGRVINR